VLGMQGRALLLSGVCDSALEGGAQGRVQADVSACVTTCSNSSVFVFHSRKLCSASWALQPILYQLCDVMSVVEICLSFVLCVSH
jgi:hypothetical protein